jgi:hypothetical protein
LPKTLLDHEERIGLTLRSAVEIIDVTDNPKYRRLQVGCIFHEKRETPLQHVCRLEKERVEYLDAAIPQGLRTKILFWRGDQVGMIEYGPPSGAGLPIFGDGIIVVNCIWVHRRAQGQHFGSLLMKDMRENQPHATGFATLALENYWMMWMRKSMMEQLGFRSIKSVRVKHKVYKRGHCFTMHLMWLPSTDAAEPPDWDESRLLYGVSCCRHHPLYWGRYGCQKQGIRQIYERC